MSNLTKAKRDCYSDHLSVSPNVTKLTQQNHKLTKQRRRKYKETRLLLYKKIFFYPPNFDYYYYYYQKNACDTKAWLKKTHSPPLTNKLVSSKRINFARIYVARTQRWPKPLE